MDQSCYSHWAVSNRSMQQTILTLLFPLLTLGVWAQGPSAEPGEIAVIQRVKTLLISSLDSSLPKVTLEFFLKYEGEGAPIQWKVRDCRDYTQDKAAHRDDSAMCVQADIGLKDGRAATILVSVGKFKNNPVDVPSVYGLRVTDTAGIIHILDRLRDLPAELHRPLPKGPKDLPPPVRAQLSLSSRKPIHERFRKAGLCLRSASRIFVTGSADGRAGVASHSIAQKAIKEVRSGDRGCGGWQSGLRNGMFRDLP